MPTWNAEQYLKFADERTQACRDLVARIAVPDPLRVIDLGCGPGNSTNVLAARWPDAEIIALDSSADMIAAALESEANRHRSIPRPIQGPVQGAIQWMTGDILEWASRTSDAPFDVVFANASLQWLPDHAASFPRLLARVAPGGAFAAQMPGNLGAPPHRLMAEIAASPAWRSLFPAQPLGEWHTQDPSLYYDVLAPHAARLDLWSTEYVHQFAAVEDILEWYKGSGMRPYLDALPSDADRKRFMAEYLDAIRGYYPPRPNGRILFPFRRLFIVAYR